MSQDSVRGGLIDLNEENFESEVLGSIIPVIVEFGASWCAPCKKQLPVLEKIASENPEIKVAKIDVDENRDLANIYSVRGVPTLMLFKDGKKIKSTVGLTSYDKILEMVQSN